MEKVEINLLSYEDLFIVFQKIDEIRESIKAKELELHNKMLKTVNSELYRPYSLKQIIENDSLKIYAIDAKKELLSASLALKAIKILE